MRTTWARKIALAVPLVLVNTVAIYGQYAWARGHLPGGWPVALGFAATLESIAIFLSVEANAALLADDAAGKLRLGSYLVGAGVGTLNYWHWSPQWTPTATAITFGVLSALSPVLWAIRSRGLHRAELRDRGLVDRRSVRFSTAQWMHYPFRTLGAYRMAVWTRTNDPDLARTEYDRRRGRNRAGKAEGVTPEPAVTDTPADGQPGTAPVAAIADRPHEAPEESAGGMPGGVQLTTGDAARIARALKAAHPDMDPDMIAPLVGRSRRTVARYLNGATREEVSVG